MTCTSIPVGIVSRSQVIFDVDECWYHECWYYSLALEYQVANGETAMYRWLYIQQTMVNYAATNFLLYDE